MNQVLKHNYVEIKQSSKVEIFYHYFVNQLSRLSMRSSPLAKKLRYLHICLHNEVGVLSNHILMYINH